MSRPGGWTGREGVAAVGTRVAIDFGTSNTCVAVPGGDGAGHIVLIDGSPLMPSAVYAAPDGTLFVGQDAQRQAAVDPARYEPHPKRRLDEGALLLGTDVWRSGAVVRAVLARCVQEIRRGTGGRAVDELVLTHPAGWGAPRRELLRQAGSGLAGAVRLLPEPVAAALFFAALPGSAAVSGAPVAVLDIGGGTTDASVVRRTAKGWEVLADRGDDTFGGTDVDEALVRHLGKALDSPDWTALVDALSLPERRRRRVLYADVRTAKEALSRHAYADVPLPEPFPDAQLTRDELETLIAHRVDGVVQLLRATIADARIRPDRLGGIYLVGGSSRIPLVARQIRTVLGMNATALEQAETVVARGALLAARPSPAPRPAPKQRPVPAMPPQPVSTSDLHVPQRGGRRMAVAAGVSAAAVVAGLVWWAGDDDGGRVEAASQREIAQYDYRFAVPDGWAQSGGDPGARQVQITPDGSVGPPAVLVEENPLDFDSDADPQRARDQLARLIAGSDPARFAGPPTTERIGERDLAHYRQLPPEGGVVDWYALFQGPVQVTVGCHAAADRERPDPELETACHQVLESLRIVR